MEEGCCSEILYSQRGKVTNVIVISIGGAACFPGLNERLSQKIAETLLRTEAEGRHVGENLTPSRSAGDTAHLHQTERVRNARRRSTGPAIRKTIRSLYILHIDRNLST